MMVGRNLSITPELDRRLREATWRRLAALEAGAKMGLRATNEEVVRAVRSQPSFQENGQFSLPRYRAYLAQVLGEMGYSGAFFEEHIRQEVLLNKLRVLAREAVLVSPLDLERTFAAIGDRFGVEYTVVAPAAVTGEVRVAAAQARERFDRDPAAYRLPPKVAVRYVRFPARAQLAQVKEPAEQDVEDYYDEHLDDFKVLVRETNRADTAAAGTNAAPAGAETVTPRWVTRPVEEVRGEIIPKLKMEAALARARAEADEFVKKISTYFQEKPLSFDEAATRSGLEVVAPPPFAAREPVAGVSAEAAFAEAAFALKDNPDEYFSNPVGGTDAVYVLALTRHLPARVPEFAEVAARVERDARAAAVAEALQAKARELRRRVEAGEGFAAAAKALGLPGAQTVAFSAAAGVADLPHADALVRGALHCNPGETTDPVPLEDGSVLVAHVVTRTPGDAATLASLRPDMVGMLRRERGRQLFESWQDDLLRKANFQDLRPPRAPSADDGDEPADEPEDA
jgi:hypothetical protein